MNGGRWQVVLPGGRSSRRFAVPSLRSSACRTGQDWHLFRVVCKVRSWSWLVVPPSGLVLAPLRGAFTSVVSLSDRPRLALVPGRLQSQELELAGCAPERAGPRAAARCLHFGRQPHGPAQTRVLRGWAFRPLPCGRILASSLHSALWIARPGAQPARFLISALPE